MLRSNRYSDGISIDLLRAGREIFLDRLRSLALKPAIKEKINVLKNASHLAVLKCRCASSPTCLERFHHYWGHNGNQTKTGGAEQKGGGKKEMYMNARVRHVWNAMSPTECVFIFGYVSNNRWFDLHQRTLPLLRMRILHYTITMLFLREDKLNDSCFLV